MLNTNSNILVKAEVLKKYMHEKNLSEKEFADAIGVAHSTVNRILNGKRNPGSKFIAGVLNNFSELTFDNIFSYDNSLPKGNEKEVC
ncbi:helix-turn-helix domain-containing protein [Heyndrickxia ginsengihumi]|uniref:helix-turn-helix domain-containing protein n=1 Tax=Heyndrickxia ginsengihumi TaxID=363870 RepID=UPI003D256194